MLTQHDKQTLRSLLNKMSMDQLSDLAERIEQVLRERNYDYGVFRIPGTTRDVNGEVMEDCDGH